MSAELKGLIDRQAIIDVGLRYASSIDERDVESFCSCFTADALWPTVFMKREATDRSAKLW